jgi:hypothetical protein
MVSVADFKIRFPEFSTVPDSTIQISLDDAALLMKDKPKWLDFYDVALMYLAAHLLYSGLQSASGDGTPLAPVSHQEVDDVIIKKALAHLEPSADELYSTSYGKRYMWYRKICLTGPRGV